MSGCWETARHENPANSRSRGFLWESGDPYGEATAQSIVAEVDELCTGHRAEEKQNPNVRAHGRVSNSLPEPGCLF
jgi:hypothetical protein